MVGTVSDSEFCTDKKKSVHLNISVITYLCPYSYILKVLIKNVSSVLVVS